MFTYLVFNHSLRIRFKSDSISGDKDQTTESGRSPGGSSLATPVAEESESGTVTEPQTAEQSEVQSEAATETETASEDNQTEKRNANLSGKINNLLTGDLNTITDSFNAVCLRKCTLR